MSETDVALQVVGFGPASLGVPVAADRCGRLDPLFDAGVLFLERGIDRRPMPGERLNFVCESNSRAEDFTVGIGREGAFSDLLDGPHGRILRELGPSPTPLGYAADFLQAVRERTQVLCAGRHSSAVRFGSEVDHLRLEDDETVASCDGSGQVIARSRRVVLATGAEEVVDHAVDRRGSLRTMTSGDVLGGARLAELLNLVQTSGDPICIVGSSHSAFSVAALLVDRFGDLLQPGRIVILARSPVRLYYRSVADAGSAPCPREVDPETGEVNRFSGIRGRARMLYFDLISGRESRVVLGRLRGRSVTTLPERALVILSKGCRWRPVRVLNRRGEEVHLRVVDQHLRVDSDGCVLDLTGERIAPLFALGQGVSRHGVPRRSVSSAVNVFHGVDAERVVTRLGEEIGLGRRALA